MFQMLRIQMLYQHYQQTHALYTFARILLYNQLQNHRMENLIASHDASKQSLTTSAEVNVISKPISAFTSTSTSLAALVETFQRLRQENKRNQAAANAKIRNLNRIQPLESDLDKVKKFGIFKGEDGDRISKDQRESQIPNKDESFNTAQKLQHSTETQLYSLHSLPFQSSWSGILKQANDRLKTVLNTPSSSRFTAQNSIKCNKCSNLFDSREAYAEHSRKQHNSHSVLIVDPINNKDSGKKRQARKTQPAQIYKFIDITHAVPAIQNQSTNKIEDKNQNLSEQERRRGIHRCRFCGTTFNDKRKLGGHVSRAHKNQNNQQRNRSNLILSGKRTRCQNKPYSEYEKRIDEQDTYNYFNHQEKYEVKTKKKSKKQTPKSIPKKKDSLELNVVFSDEQSSEKEEISEDRIQLNKVETNDKRIQNQMDIQQQKN